jgi:hypothetical protein
LTWIDLTECISMRKNIALVAALMLASVTIAGCRDGNPGHDSDRPHHGHHRR